MANITHNKVGTSAAWPDKKAPASTLVQTVGKFDTRPIFK
jgi:hypothetical protein